MLLRLLINRVPKERGEREAGKLEPGNSDPHVRENKRERYRTSQLRYGGIFSAQAQTLIVVNITLQYVLCRSIILSAFTYVISLIDVYNHRRWVAPRDSSILDIITSLKRNSKYVTFATAY